MRDPDWLLDCTPREVQLEALRRSYGGFSLREDKNDAGCERVFRDGPDVGWGHYLQMRLGKTPTFLNEFELFARDHGFKKAVVFSPNSYKEAWAGEASRLGASVPWTVFESKGKKGTCESLKSAKGQFGLSVNYEALNTDFARGLLPDVIDKHTLVGVDESVKIKNHTSIQSRAVRALAAQAGAVRLLSGLPMVQGPQDLYPQLRSIRRVEGMNFYAFRNKYCKMGGFKGKQVKGAKNEEKLRAALSRCSFIAKKVDWGNETGAEYHQEMLTLPDALQKHYDSMLRDMKTELSPEKEVTAEMVITKLIKLAQISSGFIIDDEKQTHLLCDPRKTPKMERLREILEETQEKIVVAYVFQSSGDALAECLKAYQPAFIRGNQWMKNESRDVESEKQRFNNDPASRVAIVQMVSGKYGHDLSGAEGDRCSKMVFFENTYSLDDRTQIEMRNTTAFQDWSNDYFDLVAGGVELLAAKALAHKKSVADAVVRAIRRDEF